MHSLPSNSHKNITEKILLNHALEVKEGFVRASVDMAMSHDATTSLFIDRFLEMNGRVWDTSKVMLVADHFSPPANIEHAAILRKFLDFAKSLSGVDLRQNEGISHQILIEDPRVVPGALVVGADSHTVMAGALGCFATGMGSTDMLRILIEGSTWFRVPQSIRVKLVGQLKSGVSGKDIALKLLSSIGEGGAVYHSIEFYDYASLSMDDRCTLCNAVVEAGAKNGVIVPDEITYEYLKLKGAKNFETVLADNKAKYVKTLKLELNELVPQVAMPESPCNVVPVNDVKGIPINRAFIGSCASGRLSDLRVAAEVLAEKPVHPQVQLVVIPASRAVMRQALLEGIIQILIDAGAIVTHPSCGPCGGISNGVLAQGEVCISTSTRNFRGRMGHRDASVYLASARTVAISSTHGELIA